MAFRPSARQLEYFIAVAEDGHFGDAARRCHVSQPTLSAQLKLLEEQLGVTLIDRGGGVVRPTVAGQTLLPLAHQALETLDHIVSAANARIGPLGGLIRLGVAPTFGPYFMPRFLARLSLEYPKLELYIREERPDGLLPAVLEGALDCVLTPLPLASEKVETRVFCREALLLGVPANHRLNEPAVVPLKALDGEQLLTLGRGHRLFDQTQALCSASGARQRLDYEGTSLDALRQMVSIGMGLSLFPAGYIASEFAKEENVALKPIEGFPMSRRLALAWRRGSARGHHYEALVALARQVVGTMAVAGLEADT